MRYITLVSFASVLLATSLASAQTCATPPQGATTFYQIEQTSGIPDSSNVPGWRTTQSTAGGSVNGPYWMIQYQKSPSLTGASAEIFVANPGTGSSANALFYKKLGQNNSVSNFLWDHYDSLDSDASTVANALEYDGFQYIPEYGTNWNLTMGTQCDISRGSYWDVWDSANQTWDNGHTTISCSGLASQTGWHHVQLYATMNQQTNPPSYTFECLVVDNNIYSLTNACNGGQPCTFNGENEGSNWSPNLGVQWQLDINVHGTAGLHEWFDNSTLNIW